MEFVLRCNDLKCRNQLHDSAVVTTCSHVFCTHCADTSGLSRSTNAHRGCPACGASLQNPDDVVVAGLNPSEDYKTSVLSGLSPTIIMECASRGLAFHSYQTSQEIIYQEHLAKGLTEKYNTLSQQMDQLIHDANSQIKALQDKMQAMQTEHTTLETKNHELVKAFKEKSISQQHVHKLYQNLKARVMASQVANAAGDEAEIATHTTRGDRFFDKFPGARTGSAIYSRTGTSQRPGVMTHTRLDSRSSGSGEHQRGGIALGRSYVPNLTGHGLGGRLQSDHSAPMGTPSQAQRSRLPVLGGTRPNAFSNIESGPPYQASPMNRQSLGGGVARNMASFALSGSGQGSRRAGRDENTGLL